MTGLLIDKRSARKITRDVVRIALRNGEFRLALGLLIWPRGWSHTRLEKPRYYRG